MWLAYILVFQNDKPVWNIIQAVVQCLLMIAVLGLTEPFVSVNENRMQLFNEFFILIFTYHLLSLTDFVPDLEMRSLIGKSIMDVTLINLGINIAFVFAQNIREQVYKLITWNKRRKYRLNKKNEQLVIEMKKKEQKMRQDRVRALEEKEIHFDRNLSEAFAAEQ